MKDYGEMAASGAARIFFLCALAMITVGCAQTQTRAALSPISEDRTIGDFDGDGRSDIAGFFEDNEGHLVVAIYRASGGPPEILWGGDISSVPYYRIRQAPPARYITACQLYSENCGGAPPEVTLTHDGLIVEGLEDHSVLLYYWEGAAFRNILIGGG